MLSRTSWRSTVAEGGVRFVVRYRGVLDASAKARHGALGLVAVQVSLLLGQAIAPGFTDYWWYLVGQTTATLVGVAVLETAFAGEGGLSWQTHAIVVVTTYVDILGTAGHLYDAWGPYDKVVHFWSGVAFAAGTYEVLRLLDQRGTIVAPPPRRVLLAVAVSFAVGGVVWEGYEYLGDVVFHTGRVQGRGDTVLDVASDTCGGVVAVVILRTREATRARPARRLAA